MAVGRAGDDPRLQRAREIANKRNRRSEEGKSPEQLLREAGFEEADDGTFRERLEVAEARADEAVKPKRRGPGRPPGSKNKPKVIEAERPAAVKEVKVRSTRSKPKLTVVPSPEPDTIEDAVTEAVAGILKAMNALVTALHGEVTGDRAAQ